MTNKYMDELLTQKTYYAHTKNGKKELLEDHLKLTLSYYTKLEKEKELDKIVKNIIKCTYPSITDEALNYTYEMFKLAIYYHDIGKINPIFQTEKMKNKMKNDNSIHDSTHANLSAKIFLENTIKSLYDVNSFSDDEKNFIVYILIYFSYAISRHHTPLRELLDYLSLLNLEFNIAPADNAKLEFFINKFKIDEISLYILTKLLYSLIITCDYYATYEFMNDDNTISIINTKKNKLFDRYTSSQLYKSIVEYSNGDKKIEGINKIRCDIFLEAQDNLKRNMNKNIFYLEAPTGSGKTNMAINLAKILYENNEKISSINYIFPFNNLIEQTANTFSNYFESYNDFIVINSITSMIDDNNFNKVDNSNDMNYDQIFVKNLFRLYPIRITSHVNLFNTLFGVSRDTNYNLYDFINSIVIIDEIQAYSNRIWTEIITMLDKYASLFNIKFIIMSATLPCLDKLLDGNDNYIIQDVEKLKDKYCNLIQNTEKYYSNPIFKDRVSIDYSLLNEALSLEALAKEVENHSGKKVLVEFIKKTTARDFYNLLCNTNKFNEVYEITGDDNNYTRKKIIENINKLSNVLVIATQTIEAGVDIDMDIGFKNVSILDSEEQFLGRINRSSKKSYECKAYFFYIDKPNDVYKNDNRINYSIIDDNFKEILKNKDFAKYYELVINKTYENTHQYNKYNIKNLFSSCGKANFHNVAEIMKLIDTKSTQVFFNYTINTDEGEIVGKEVWEKYKELCLTDDIPYAQKQVELSKLRDKINLFTYNIQSFDEKKEVYYTEKFAGMYYVEDGENFISQGKFDRKKYIHHAGGMFL